MENPDGVDASETGTIAKFSITYSYTTEYLNKNYDKKKREASLKKIVTGKKQDL